VHIDFETDRHVCCNVHLSWVPKDWGTQIPYYY